MSKEIFKVDDVSFPLQEQINVTDLTVEDVAHVSEINEILVGHIDEIAEQFYNKILSVPKLKYIIEEHSSVEKLKITLKRHIQTMFTANLNDEYLAERNQIALIHYLINLEPKWYIAAFQFLNNLINEKLMRDVVDKVHAAYLSTVVTKYISIEMQIVLEAYETKVLSNLEIDTLLQSLEDEES